MYNSKKLPSDEVLHPRCCHCITVLSGIPATLYERRRWTGSGQRPMLRGAGRCKGSGRGAIRNRCFDAPNFEMARTEGKVRPHRPFGMPRWSGSIGCRHTPGTPLKGPSPASDMGAITRVTPALELAVYSLQFPGPLAGPSSLEMWVQHVRWANPS